MRFCALLLGMSGIDNTKKEHRPDDILSYPARLRDAFYFKKTEYEPY